MTWIKFSKPTFWTIIAGTAIVAFLVGWSINISRVKYSQDRELRAMRALSVSIEELVHAAELCKLTEDARVCYDGMRHVAAVTADALNPDTTKTK